MILYADFETYPHEAAGRAPCRAIGRSARMQSPSRPAIDLAIDEFRGYAYPGSREQVAIDRLIFASTALEVAL